jgi:hypothetical protein
MARPRAELSRPHRFTTLHLPFSEDPLMRALITLCAAALLFAVGCSKTNDAAHQDNPTPPADQSAAPATPPPDQPPPSDSTTPPPGDQTTPPDQQPPQPQQQ